MKNARHIIAVISVIFALSMCIALPIAASAAPKPDPIPVITSLSVYNGPPDTLVTIYGTGFGAQKQSSIVWFNGVRAHFSSWTDTAVSFRVPAGVGAGYVGIQNDGGMSNGKYFIPFAAPTLISATPLVQARGRDVTITGSLFGATQGTGWVSFGGAPGTVKLWSDTLIVATVPAAANSGYLGVVQNGLTSNGVLFTPYWQPRVTSLSANYTLVGNTVTINGTDFGSTPDKVVLNGVRFNAATWTDTRVTFTVPAGTGSGYVGIVRGDRVSNGIYLWVAPKVTSLSSWWAAPGTRVTVTGQGFGSTAGRYVLIFGGNTVTADSWSDTSVTFTVPLTAPSGYVGFTDSQRAATSNGIWLLVVKPAVISAVTPASVSSGATITVTGTDFGATQSSSSVRFNGANLAVLSWSDTQIVAVAPAGPAYGYIGVWKSGVASNGKLLNVAAPVSGGPAVATALSQTAMQRTFGEPPTTLKGTPVAEKTVVRRSPRAPKARY